jgi:hypothetical protein
MELANKEFEKTAVSIKEKARIREKSLEKAKIRGKQAFLNQKNKEKMKEFEKSLEKLEIQENQRKIQEERRILAPM